MQLPLVDVHAETVSLSWPLLLEAVRDADFIALDLELSGLGSIIGRGKGLTIEQRYGDVCETVNTRAILSLGVACFQWRDAQEDCLTDLSKRSPESTISGTTELPSLPAVELQVSSLPPSSPSSVAAKVFNVWLLSQRPYTIDPSSAKFLLQHGFDFNKQFAKGVPYTPGPLNVLEGGGVSVHHLLTTILATETPVVVHNGWVDLLFLYGNFYAPLPPSLGTLTADMSEMFVGGVYDTKAIAQFEVPQEATFLEYLFRKCQRDNDALISRGSPHLHLSLPSLAPSVPVELVPLSPPGVVQSLEQVADITVCDTFAQNGYCHKTSCPHSHDVLNVLVQREHRLLIRQLRRKRTREQKKKKLANGGLQDTSPPPSKQLCREIETQEQQGPTVGAAHSDSGQSSNRLDLVEQFTCELGAARSRLAKTDPATGDADIQPTAAATRGSEGSTETAQKPSFGHRAGFDAFMTGYVFAYFAALTQSNKTSAQPLKEAMITGLSPMRNRLSNRNKSVPLILAKSQFDKTSDTHRQNCSKIAEFKKTRQN